ncbi:MAG TPA: hypothetical protein VFM18_03910 [Methanosarcina sp.]|nr:hypothetical protein [Methanosarcina sp.]
MPQHRLYGLRGKAYVAKYKQLYEELKEVIEEDFNAVVTETGKFSLRDFGKLCMKHRIPATVMDFDNLLDHLPSEENKNYAEYLFKQYRDKGIALRYCLIILDPDSREENHAK